MKTQKWILLLLSLVFMAGTAGALTWLRMNQKLGKPGLKATPIAGEINMKISLPEKVLDFTSTNVPEPDIAIGYFPKDTSYVERYYHGSDGLPIQSTVILMGADRTSIHRPDYCLPGQGWDVGPKEVLNIPIADNPPYQIEAAAWKLSQNVKQPDGQNVKVGGVYVFWFVADNEETMNHDKMLEWLALDLFRTGALQRWAYVSYFSPCEPEQEDAVIERLQKFIAAAAPQFELPLTKK